MPLEFLLNGETAAIPNDSGQATLLDFIRARGLTGAKEGCAEGECGACAVAVVEADGRGSAYRVINSCLMFLPMAAGREVHTVESLARGGELSDAQSAMARAGGSQCGYCTPGFVVSLFAEQHRPNRTGPCDTMALTGNLCRCTGYRPIRDAALALGAPPDGPLARRLSQPAPRLDAASAAKFSRPDSVVECAALLREHPGAAVVAGATDLAVESNLRARRWPHLISLDAIDELREFSTTDRRVLIGAGLPLSDVARKWSEAPEAFREWVELFASPLIRNRATLGGNLATASPIGDAAPLLLALDAVVHLAGESTRRELPLSAFYHGYRKTALAAGEIITTIEIPNPLPAFVRFYKVSKRRLDDISTVSAAIALNIDRSGKINQARLAFGGVAATPVRVIEAENALVDQAWNAGAVDKVNRILDRALNPMSDHRGSKEYRLEVSKSLVEKCYWEYVR